MKTSTGAARRLLCVVAVLSPGILLAPIAVAAPYSPDALTDSGLAVAGALDALAPEQGGSYVEILGSIDALPTTTARADALDQLSARNYRLLPRLAVQSLDATDRTLRGYLVQRREMALDASADVSRQGDRTLNFMVSYGLKQNRYEARPDRPSANGDS